MILYISLGNPDLKRTNRPLYRWWWSTLLEHKFKFEEISGRPCHIARYDRINQGLIDNLNPTHILISGCFAEFDQYDPAEFDRLQQLIRDSPTPLFGMCAGLAQIVSAFDGEAGPIGFGDPDDPNLQPIDHIPAGAWREHGFTPVDIKRHDHPMTVGLLGRSVFYQTHYWKTTRLPAEFDLLGSTDLVEVQMIAHQSRPIWATQFHPEQFDNEHPDGLKLLQRFFDYTG